MIKRIRRYVLWAVLAACLLGKLGAEEFRYQHRAGDSYRILSVVNEDVYLDRKLNHQAEILNRIAVKVLSEANGKGRHEAVFQTSERSVQVNASAGRIFQWAREYSSIFERDSLGYITIDVSYFMPVVRNVPVVPGRDLKPGDTWSAEGHEMHDFRDSFGIAEPYRIPFTAHYTYLGNRMWKDREYPAFSVSYRIAHEPPAVRGTIWPRRITGASDQIVYWDREKGQPQFYEESFRMLFELSTGMLVEYRGTARAEILESEDMDKEGMADQIAADLEGLQGTTVRVDQEGVTISLEAIQFAADSPDLLPVELAKLDRIGEILSRYPDRDILVGGHTALAGNAAGRQTLSAQRAATVADYLVRRGVREEERVVVRGYGADRPIADNNTAAGRERNRRVEITILEN
ncbi:MAG: OmpA family protein [Treponema sp.]|nr:OmpA family protein [Treponema sp.]